MEERASGERGGEEDYSLPDLEVFLNFSKKRIVHIFDRDDGRFIVCKTSPCFVVNCFRFVGRNLSPTTNALGTVAGSMNKTVQASVRM